MIFRNVLMLALATAIYPFAGYAQSAGQIEFAVGNVSAIAANGYPRSLRKGAEINAGDTVVTDYQARAQVNFSDGGYISLQPNTRFRIDEYRYQGSADGSEKSFFSLVKGGLRAVTGIIGKTNKSNYQVNTPIATIGIRGTHFTLRLCENDCVAGGSRLVNGLYASVGEGQIYVANPLGRLNLEQGQKGYVANLYTAPAPTNQPPILSAPQPHKAALFLAVNQPGFIAGDQRDAAGLPANLQAALRVVKPASGVIAANIFGPQTFNLALQNFNVATLDGLGHLSSYQDTTTLGPEIKQGTTVLRDAGADKFISWGRWTNGQTTLNAAGVPLAFPGNESLHYVVTGNPSPASAFTGVGNLTYTFLAGTSATSNTGGVGAGVLSGSLTLALGTAPTLTANFKVGYESAIYNTTVAAPVTGAAFFGTGSATGGTCPAVGGCAAGIKGVFAGPNAERAGLLYGISDTAANGSPLIVGAAVFTR